MNHNGTNTLPLHIHDDSNGLDYTLHGDRRPSMLVVTDINEARLARLHQCQTPDEIIAAILAEDEELESVDSKEEIMDLDLDF